MRRCLRAFLVGLITLSLLSGPAHACWRSRQARHCRPVVVVACPAPAWTACCDPCGPAAVVVESHCPPAPACCGEGVVVRDEWLAVEDAVVAEGMITGEATDAAVETVIDTTAAPAPIVAPQPTPAPEAQPPVAAAVPPAAGLAPASSPPALAPAGESGGVQTTSNEQPLSLPAAPATVAEPPAAAPESVLADEAAMGQPAAGEGVVSPAAPAEPLGPAADTVAPAPETVTPAPEVPEMAPEEPLPVAEPVPADEPAADAEPAVEPAMEEDADVADEAPEMPAPAEPEPLEPEPVVEPQPEPAPEEGNIFEELDAEGDEAAAAGEEEPAMTEEPAAGEPEEPVSDPFGDGGDGEAGESAADPEMTDEVPAADPDAGGSEPADPFAGGEPARRWIDATGTASMVATLIEVGADGRCVLETRGRRIAVPVENLSGHDRDYVRQAGVRLAKSRATEAGKTAAAAPAPTDTAGL